MKIIYLKRIFFLWIYYAKIYMIHAFLQIFERNLKIFEWQTRNIINVPMEKTNRKLPMFYIIGALSALFAKFLLSVINKSIKYCENMEIVTDTWLSGSTKIFMKGYCKGKKANNQTSLENSSGLFHIHWVFFSLLAFLSLLFHSVFATNVHFPSAVGPFIHG